MRRRGAHARKKQGADAHFRRPRRPHPPTPLSLKGEGGSEKSGLSRSPPPSPARERGAGGVRSAGKAERQKPVEHPLDSGTSTGARVFSFERGRLSRRRSPRFTHGDLPD